MMGTRTGANAISVPESENKEAPSERGFFLQGQRDSNSRPPVFGLVSGARNDAGQRFVCGHPDILHVDRLV